MRKLLRICGFLLLTTMFLPPLASAADYVYTGSVQGENSDRYPYTLDYTISWNDETEKVSVYFPDLKWDDSNRNVNSTTWTVTIGGETSTGLATTNPTVSKSQYTKGDAINITMSCPFGGVNIEQVIPYTVGSGTIEEASSETPSSVTIDLGVCHFTDNTSNNNLTVELDFDITTNNDGTISVTASSKESKFYAVDGLKVRVKIGDDSFLLTRNGQEFSGQSIKTYNSGDVLSVKFEIDHSLGFPSSQTFPYKVASNTTTGPAAAPAGPATYTGTVDFNEGSFPYTLKYTITWNSDQTITINPEFIWKNTTPSGLSGNYYFIINNNQYGPSPAPYNTNQSFNENEQVTVKIKVEYENGAAEPEFTYIVGSVNGENPGTDPENPTPSTGGSYYGEMTGTAETGGTEYPYTFQYAITWNENGTLTVTPKFIWTNGEPSILLCYLYVNNDETSGTYGSPITTSNTYEKGQSLNMNVKIVFTTGGMVQPEFRYTVGDTNEAPENPEPEPGVTAPTTLPETTHNSADVLSVYGYYGNPGFEFKFDQWDNQTQKSDFPLGGQNLLHVTNFKYFGLVCNDGADLTNKFDASAYSTLHVDYWTPDGTSFGVTPISASDEGKNNRGGVTQNVIPRTWNSVDVPMTSFTGMNFDDLFQIKFDGGNNGEAYIANIYFWKESDALSLKVGEVTVGLDSATIPYELIVNGDASENVQVSYTFQESKVELGSELSGEINLSNLDQNTEYSLVISASATVEGETYEVSENVTFKTDREKEGGLTYYAYPHKATLGEKEQNINILEKIKLNNNMKVTTVQNEGEDYYHFVTGENVGYAQYSLSTLDDLKEVILESSSTEDVDYDYDLVFDIRSTDVFNFYMKMAWGRGPEAEPLFDFIRDGEWQTVKIPINDNYVGMVNYYRDHMNDDYKEFVFFCPVIKGPNGNTEKAYEFDVTNIRLEPIERKLVDSDNTYYGYYVYEKGSVSGIFEYEITVNPYDDNSTSNDDSTVGDNTDHNGQTLTIYVNFTSQDDIQGLDKSSNYITIIKDNQEYKTKPNTVDNGYDFTYTSKGTFYEHDILNFKFKIAITNDVIEVPISYVFGWNNEKTELGPIVSYEISDLNAKGATVNFKSILPRALDKATVVYKNDGQEVGNPWVITDLEPLTYYPYKIVATATTESGVYKDSEPFTIEFTTLREGEEVAYRGEEVLNFENYFTYADDGITADNRDTRQVNFTYSITYTNEGKLKFDFSTNYKNFNQIAGLDPSINIFTSQETSNDNKYEGKSIANVNSVVTDKYYNAGDTYYIQFWFPYAGGPTATFTVEYTVGENADPKLELNPGFISYQSARVFYTVKGLNDDDIYYVAYRDVKGGDDNYIVWKNTEGNEKDPSWIDGTNPITISGLSEETEYTYEVLVKVLNYDKDLVNTITFTTSQKYDNDIIGNIFVGETKEDEAKWKTDDGEFKAKFILQYYTVVNEDLTFTVYFNVKVLDGGEGYENEIKDLIFSHGGIYFTPEGGNQLPIQNVTYDGTNPNYPMSVTYPNSLEPGDKIRCSFMLPYYNGGQIVEVFYIIYGASSKAAMVNDETSDYPWSRAWHPHYIMLDKVLSFAPGTNYTSANIQVEIKKNDAGEWKKATEASDYLNEIDSPVYNSIIQSGSVNGYGQPISKKCDGYSSDEEPQVEMITNADGTISFQLTVDCSGLYDVVLSSNNEGNEDLKFSFFEDAAHSTLTIPVNIYPTYVHKYTYNLLDKDGNQVTAVEKDENNQDKEREVINVDDVFNINSFYWDSKKPDELVYSNEHLDALENAVVYFPGIYDAEIYFWISEGHVTKEPEQPGTVKAPGKRKANSNNLPEGYDRYLNNELSNGGVADLSALQSESGLSSLNLVMVKNGAITPINPETGVSATAVPISFDSFENSSTSVEAIAPAEMNSTDVYTLSGIRVASGVDFNEIKSQLAPGLYIVGGKKVIIR